MTTPSSTSSRVATRHAWLQKHPSPLASRGEFHWYPAERADLELRSSFVERAAGLDAPAVLWRLAPGRVAWAQLFAATAPTDGRRYTGMVLSVADQPGATAAELLAGLEVPAPSPFGVASATTADDEHCDNERLARALVSGELVAMRGVRAVQPRDVAALAALLPDELARTARDGGCRAAASDSEPARRDVVAELLSGASVSPAGSTAVRAWRLLCEIAASMRRSLDDVCAQLAILWADGALTDEERALLSHTGDFAALLHAWGRGRLDNSSTAATLPARLADAVALRALARLLDGDDPARAIAEARWHALLPADRRAELVETIVTRAPSLLWVIGARGGARSSNGGRHA